MRDINDHLTIITAITERCGQTPFPPTPKTVTYVCGYYSFINLKKKNCLNDSVFGKRFVVQNNI